MTKTNDSLTEALLDMADGMRRAGIMAEAPHKKITQRHLGAAAMPAAAPISHEEIRQVRMRAHVSQAVFARYLNVSTSYISQLERGTKQPSGAALAMLNLIRRKGIEAIL